MEQPYTLRASTDADAVVVDVRGGNGGRTRPLYEVWSFNQLRKALRELDDRCP